MVRRAWLLPIVAGLSLAACIRVPSGPNVMVLPGAGKDFDQFQIDDDVCREWAARRTGVRASRAANDTAVANAAVGTVLGAATGAAIGAASGNPATGAAVGAGAGLLGGSLVGASNAEATRWTIQRRYDTAYMQCMYAKGNQIPVPRGSEPRSKWRRPPPPPRSAPDSIPPPPPGAPPSPPSGAF
jgi:hypothetical protein